eukprot:scaffold178571_cov28-Tisochrysis_lutea.AAC.1
MTATGTKSHWSPVSRPACMASAPTTAPSIMPNTTESEMSADLRSESPRCRHGGEGDSLHARAVRRGAAHEVEAAEREGHQADAPLARHLEAALICVDLVRAGLMIASCNGCMQTEQLVGLAA